MQRSMGMMEDTLRRKRECWPAGYPGMGKTDCLMASVGNYHKIFKANKVPLN